MENSKKLEYLNLEIGQSSERITIDNQHINCYSKRDEYKHIFHTQHGAHNNLSNLYYQQNTLCDLCLNILHNQTAQRQSDQFIWERFVNLNRKSRQTLQSVEEKVNFLTEKSERSFINKLVTKEDLQKFLLQVEQEPKEIERTAVQLITELDKRVDKLEELIVALNHKLSILMS